MCILWVHVTSTSRDQKHYKKCLEKVHQSVCMCWGHSHGPMFPGSLLRNGLTFAAQIANKLREMNVSNAVWIVTSIEQLWRYQCLNSLHLSHRIQIVLHLQPIICRWVISTLRPRGTNIWHRESFGENIKPFEMSPESVILRKYWTGEP